MSTLFRFIEIVFTDARLIVAIFTLRACGLVFSASIRYDPEIPDSKTGERRVGEA